MKVIYDGPHDAVDIGSSGVVAVRGVPVDVDPTVAESLVEQDAWTLADGPPPAVDPDNLDKATVPVLKSFALESGIELGEASKKKEIVNIIEAHLDADEGLTKPEIRDDAVVVNPTTENEGA